MRAFFPCLAGLMVVLASTASRGGEPAWPELRDGDRVVLVGDTTVERDQRYGYLETMLTLLNPARDVTFRNLGWSGDTVAGLSRAGFDPPEAGYRQLIEQLLAAKPTVLVVGYGMAESFDGEEGRPRFVAGLKRLLDAAAPTKARVVLLSPIAHARMGPPQPDPTAHNAALERFSQSIAEVARGRGAAFIDLFEPSRVREGQAPISDDGIHPNEAGYRFLAGRIARGPDAGARPESPAIEMDAYGTVGSIHGAAVGQADFLGGALRFRVARETLAVAGDEVNRPLFDTGLTLKVTGLLPAQYELKIDGRPVATRSANRWAQGVRIESAPDLEQIAKLRSAINRKNRLFFDRWRPQNITYLFGFRKHEQGNNAVEIPRFDPLVAEQEKEIARLRKPAPHSYELTRVEDADR